MKNTMICSALLVLNLTLPCTSRAQDTFPTEVPRRKVVWQREPASDVATLTFDETKKLALIYNDYLFLHSTYFEHTRLIPQLRSALSLKGEAYVVLAQALDVSEAARHAQLKELEAVVEEKNKHKRWALSGQALPWVVSAGLVLFATGMYTGVRLTRP